MPSSVLPAQDRSVLIGEPSKLYRLQEKDLEKDGRNAFWLHVDFSGFDLSNFDMLDADTIHCNGDESILPTGARYWMSRHTSLKGATIPHDVNHLAHDPVSELLNQHTATGKDAEHIEWVASHVALSYWNSWKTAIWWLVNERGLTTEKVWDIFSKYAFAGHKSCLARLEVELRGSLSKDPPVRPEDHITLHSLNTRLYKTDWSFALSQDRYEVARGIEADLNTREPKQAPWIAWVGQLEPFFVGVASPASQVVDRYNWWGKLSGA